MLPSELVRPLVESSDESEPRGARRGLFAAPAPMLAALPLEEAKKKESAKLKLKPIKPSPGSK